MKRRCTGFRYAAVLEDGPTKDNPHVHVMCIMEDVPKTWKNHTIAKENPMENRESAHGNIDIGYFWPLGIVQAKPFRLGRFDIWSKTGWPEAEYYDVKVATTPEAMLKVKTTYGPPTMAGAYIAKYLDKVEDTTHRVKTSMGFGLDVIKEAIASMEQRDYRPLTEGLTAPGTKPTRLSQVENPFGMEGQNFPPQSVISTIARAERERVLWENKPGLMLGQQTYERKNNLYQEVAAAVESAGESDPSDYVHKNTEELAYERMSHPDRRERAWRTLAQKLGYDPERFDFETRRKEPEIESTAIPELGEFHKNLEPATESIPAHKMASDLATRFQRHHYEEKKRDADAA